MVRSNAVLISVIFMFVIFDGFTVVIRRKNQFGVKSDMIQQILWSQIP